VTGAATAGGGDAEAELCGCWEAGWEAGGFPSDVDGCGAELVAVEAVVAPAPEAKDVPAVGVVGGATDR
jgi:hypothetical protein